MKTDEFVTLLATSVTPIKSGVTRRRYALALASGGFLALLLMLMLLGVREDLAKAVYLPMFWFKFAFPLCLAGAALIAAMRLSRPGIPLGRVLFALAAPVVIVWLMAATTLLNAAPGERAAQLLGQTWAVCPLLITMLSIPTFVGIFWAMKGLAPTRPALAGAAAGLLASTVATVIYSLHCPEMAASFLATWYLIGMLIPTFAGALLGIRLLKW